MIKKFIPAGIALTAALALTLTTSCSLLKKNKQEETVQEERIPVRVETLERRAVDKTLDYAANLQAEEQVFYAPAAAGRITKIYVEVGDRVRKGQLLVDMDRTQLKQAQVQLKNLKTEYDRVVKLKKTNSISQQQYDAAVTQYEVTKANVEFLEENTRMIAPFDGVITGKYFENGEIYTGAGAYGGAGKPSIVALEKINVLKAYVDLSEQYFLEVKEGTRVQLRNNIYPDRVFEGKVSIAYPTINPASRTFTVEIKVPNKDEALRPGMYATINFLVNKTDAVLAPALAVLKLQGANNRYVFINKDGVAKRVEVKLGRRYDDRIELISDEIEEGDEIVVAGQGRLVDGSLLDIIRDEPQDTDLIEVIE